jgi:C4-dicarboxylate transporter DctM subunit
MVIEVLIFVLLVLFVINVPIAIAIGVASIATILVQGDISIMMVAQRLYSGVDSLHLTAVPLFLFTGSLMEAAGLSRRIISFVNTLVGWMPGGLATVSIVSSMFFAGLSGSAAVDAAVVGTILIPAMKKSGYQSDYAAAVQSSSASIGVIIPPSIPMILFGFLTGVSVNRLFIAGILPGVLIGISLVTVSTILSSKHGYGAITRLNPKNILVRFKEAFWALGTLFIILGGILSGVFTATESAAVAVVYTFCIGLFIYKKIHWKEVFYLFRDGAITSSVILFIIATASIFGWIVAIEEIPSKLSASLLSFSDNPIALLLLVNIVLLIAGTLLEITTAMILLVPMIVAISPALEISLIQLGVIVVVNLAIGMLTPPVGVCLIVSSTISGDNIMAVFRRVLPFLLVLIVDLLIITFCPPLTMWLANLIRL